MSAARMGARMGAAAFALGLSLTGPQALGLAAADTAEGTATAESSAPESEPAPSARPARTARVPRQAAATAAAATAAAPAAAQGRRGAAPARTPRPSAARTRADRSVPVLPQRVITGNLADGAATVPVTVPAVTVAVSQVVAEVTAPVSAAPAPAKLIAAQIDPMPAIPVRTAPTARMATMGVPVGHATGEAITDVINGLLAPIQSLFEGVGLLIRRTLFNQAPSVSPMQITGQASGAITGTLNAVDAEGDPLSFRITTAPSHGSVTVAADGTYTYSPAEDFSGIDSFNVAVADGGFHINLLDLFRPASTEAYVQVAQNAGQPVLTFNFVYGSGSQFWSPAARSALQSAALSLAGYFVVTRSTIITYDVTGESSSFSSTLASAGSDLTDGGPGFFATVVQQKIQTGEDGNGAAADGEISWNFGRSWAFGSSVGSGQYDFTSTAMHELLHTFGFLSNTDRPGSNTGRSWTTFDGFIVTSGGARVIDPATFNWLTTYNPNLTGGNGGLYFAGPNAVLVYGSPVPLYTPSSWSSGSSVSHLDDDTFVGAADKLMNATSSAGRGIRVISPVELAMLRDLGYTVTDTPVYAVVFLGFGLLRRRERGARR